MVDQVKIRIDRITDFAIAIFILNNAAIAAEIYEDGARFTLPDLVGEFWIAAYVDNKLAGCYRIHCMGALMWQIHCRLLPEYRQKWAEKISRAALCWAADNIENLKAIMCFVPACHKNVALHCERVGFKKSGKIEASYLKNGQVIDQAIYAISIDKIKSNMG